MKDYEGYRREYDRSEQFFRAQISDRESKSFEYGLILVKNAMIVAGGGLLSIPAILGLSSSISLNHSAAATAGVSFAAALIVSILGCYLIHLNWLFHSMSWEEMWENRQEYLENLYLEEVPYEVAVVGQDKVFYKKRMLVTFWGGHICAMLYLIAVVVGFLSLYAALEVTR